jgi:hypothetical protein
MSGEYRHNHYVPVWYQKRFLPRGQKDQEFFYLDLKPRTFLDPRGLAHQHRPLRRLGFKHCFAEDDLYTTRFGGMDSTAIEQQFFGGIDTRGRHALEYFTKFSHPSVHERSFRDLLTYMSTQKLRTPKGLNWLGERAGKSDKDGVLRLMIRLRDIYCATWTECVWLLADAAQSPTKFIVSDHPVTVYNRSCGPKSDWCRGNNDPDIRFHATHTIFPLTLERILILTNLSWVRNPYQRETNMRPNPELFRSAMFNFTDIQTHRLLSEREVREINFITKTRAFRYIGAAKEDWLYPEKDVSKSDWHEYGNGYLLMPDPRAVTYSTEFLIGYKDGSAAGFDEYGRRPWQKGYSGRSGPTRDDWHTSLRFHGEFARLIGPYRRGRSFNFMRLDDERDSDDFHQYNLSLEKEHRDNWKKKTRLKSKKLRD